MRNLEQHVTGLNFHNEQSLQAYQYFLTLLEAFKGKKVHTVKNEPSKALNEAITPQAKKDKTEKGFFDFHCWLEFTGRSMWLKTKTYFNGGSYDVKPSTAFCIYYNNAFFLADVEDCILTEIAKKSTQDSWVNTLQPVTFEQAFKSIEAVKKAIETARNLESKLNEHLKSFVSPW